MVVPLNQRFLEIPEISQLGAPESTNGVMDIAGFYLKTGIPSADPRDSSCKVSRAM